MRFSFGLVAALAAGCGSSVPDPNNHADSGNGSGSGSGSGSGGQDPNAAFYVRSADLTLQPGEEVTKCYYFHTSNTEMKPISKWVAHMSPGSHHMIMYFPSSGDTGQTDGTINEDCNTLSGVPTWIFASQQEDLTLQFPTDDGGGKPLAQEIPAHQSAYIQMHYINLTEQPETVHVEVNAYATTASAYTKTSPYITYQTQITIPPEAVGTTVTQSCPVPAGVKFWEVSTHSHKRSVHTEILDGTGMVFQSDDWEHPGDKEWDASPFYAFANKLTWTCVYNNNNPNDPMHTMQVDQGQSAATKEMCMATGYVFPAASTKICACAGATCGIIN